MLYYSIVYSVCVCVYTYIYIYIFIYYVCIHACIYTYVISLASVALLNNLRIKNLGQTPGN